MGVYRFAGRGGVELACRETGSGRPLVLLHGFMGAGSHMLSYGRVGGLAEQGYRLIVPDFRGHGDSAKPHDPAAYPPDVLADDELKQLAVPTLLLLGENEIMYKPRQALDRAARLIPHLETALIPRAGHLLNSDQPKVVDEHIVRFFTSDST